MLECNIKKNQSQCTCTYESCDRKGKCCECIAYHWRAKQLPGCLFTPEGEKSYDRSIRRFILENKSHQ